MKKIIIIIILLLILATAAVYFRTNLSKTFGDEQVPGAVQNQQNLTSEIQEDFSVLATNLDTPWEIVFLPDKNIIFTERSGSLHIVDSTGKQVTGPIKIEGAVEIGEGGLLGVAVHPDFRENNYIFVYFTYSGEPNRNTANRVVRYKLENNTLAGRTVIVDGIPGASNHNGGRIAFGPDRYLYITTGDAQDPSLAQNTNSFAGKILRVTEDGNPAPGNPFANEVYSYGHRNPQGLAWDSEGNLWATEHGRSGIASGLDEINRIESGKNYGWPTVEGNASQAGMTAPVLNSGTATTWAPAGAAVIGNTLYFTGLRGESLYKATLDGTTATYDTSYFVNKYGRLRALTRGPDGFLYISTSNRDGRGSPAASDDRIFRINPESL